MVGILLLVLGLVIICILLTPTDLWFPYSYSNLSASCFGNSYKINYVNLRTGDSKTEIKRGEMTDEMFLLMRASFLANKGIDINKNPHLKKLLLNQGSDKSGKSEELGDIQTKDLNL